MTKIAAFVLAAAAFWAPAFAEDPPATLAAPAAPAAPAANMGRVYVSYPVQEKANYDANLAIDDLWLSNQIKSGSCVYYDLPVGEHSFHSTTTPVKHVSVTAGGAFYIDLMFRGGTTAGLVPADGDAPANLSACTQGVSPL